MIIRRKTVGSRRLSENEITVTSRTECSTSAFLQGFEAFCENDLSGIVELNYIGREQPDAAICISPEGAAYLFRLIIELTGEDGQAYIAASVGDESLLIMFRLSYGLPELCEIEKIRRAGIEAGFEIRVGEGVIFAEATLTRGGITLGTLSGGDFLTTLISVFYY